MDRAAGPLEPVCQLETDRLLITFYRAARKLCLLQLVWYLVNALAVSTMSTAFSLHPFTSGSHRHAIAVRLMKATTVVEAIR